MDLVVWIGTSCSLSFSAGVAFASLVCWRIAVPKTEHALAVQELEKQRDTIDRLLSRHSERIIGRDVERFKREFGKMAGQEPETFDKAIIDRRLSRRAPGKRWMK